MWAKVSGFEVASDDDDDVDDVDDSAEAVVATVSVLNIDVVAKHRTEEEAEQQRSILWPEDKTLKENIL